jgi:hypothetical protein
MHITNTTLDPFLINHLLLRRTYTLSYVCPKSLISWSIMDLDSHVTAPPKPFTVLPIHSTTPWVVEVQDVTSNLTLLAPLVIFVEKTRLTQVMGGN